MAASGSIVTVNQFVQAAGWGLGGFLTVLAQTYTLTVFTARLFFISGLLIRLPDFKKAIIPRQKARAQSVWRTVYRKKTVFLAYDDGHVGRFSKCSLDFRRFAGFY
nr:hypothetical protein [Bacillus licheniformis]